jgi:uncharacterized protein (TIGR03437 family)
MLKNVPKPESPPRVVVPVPVRAAGNVAGSPGVEYVTLKIPHSLAEAGLVPVTITDENFTSNAVEIDIQ